MKRGRERKILEMLKTDEFITSSSIADQMNLSERTVQTIIKQMNYDKTVYGVHIVSKKGYGYSLEIIDQELYNKSLSFLIDFHKSEVPDTPEGRNLYVAMQLLLSNQYITLDDLADQLYVSKSTITNTIKSVKALYSKYGIKIDARPNYGIKIICDELSRRRCIVECLRHSQEIRENNVEFENIIKNVLDDVFGKERFAISSVSRNNLILHISISLRRIQKGFFLNENHKFVSKDEENLRISNIIANKLEKSLQLKIPDNEIDYIAIQLACKQIIDKENPKQNLVFTQSILDIVGDMLLRVYDAFKIDFINDLELQMNLCQHLIPLKVRLKYGFLAENPLLEEIKKEYPLGFEMATLASSVLEEQYLRKMSEDEIGYIAMTFALALEKRKSNYKKNILLICGTGRGSAKLLQLKIEKLFKDTINQIMVCDIHKILEVDFTNIDYVFTTISIPVEIPVPIVEMPVFLNEDNIYEIKQKFEKNEKIVFQKYFSSKLFFPHLTCSTKEEVLKFICSECVEKGFSNDDLYHLVMDREKLGKTTFGNLVAMPHPTKTSSSKTYISVCILDNPIDWDKTPVQVIFLISIAHHSSQRLDDFYKGIIRLFTNKNQIHELIQKQNYETLKSIVKMIEG